jgi:uncharacterized protein
MMDHAEADTVDTKDRDGSPADAALLRLHPRAVVLWRLTALIRGAFLTALALVAEWFLDTPLPVGTASAVVAVLAIADAAVVPPWRYRSWGFALRDADLYLRYGILFRTTTIVPHARIQHVDTHHGPMDRALGLADLVVYTAGTRGAIVTVPALGMAAAEALRDRLADLSGAGDAV